MILCCPRCTEDFKLTKFGESVACPGCGLVAMLCVEWHDYDEVPGICGIYGMQNKSGEPHANSDN